MYMENTFLFKSFCYLHWHGRHICLFLIVYAEKHKKNVWNPLSSQPTQVANLVQFKYILRKKEYGTASFVHDYVHTLRLIVSIYGLDALPPLPKDD